MSGGDQKRLQPRNHGIARMEEVVNLQVTGLMPHSLSCDRFHLYTVWPRRLGLARRLPVRQDYGQRTAQQEKVANIKMEVGVSRLVITDGEVLPVCCLRPPAGALPGEPRPEAAVLRLLLALAGVHPGLAGLPAQRIVRQQRANTISQQANLKKSMIIVISKIEDTQRFIRMQITCPLNPKPSSDWRKSLYSLLARLTSCDTESA